MELKSGETYNGHLVSCDNWMNISLREVICTSRVNIKYLHLKINIRYIIYVCKIVLSLTDSCISYLLLRNISSNIIKLHYTLLLL